MAQLPKDMLAARCLRYHASPPLEVVRIPLPLPGPDEILIKVTAASLCHTDIAMCLGDKTNEGNSLPQTAGHEPCGTIVMTGSRVTDFREGDRVGFVNHAGSCGVCQECLSGHNTYCLGAETKLRGVNADGCFSEYAIGDAIYCFRIPNKLSDAEAAPLMCAGVTAYAAIMSTALQSGQWLAISGCGGVGHLAIQFAKAIVDIRNSSLELAERLGADLTINTSSAVSVEDIIRSTGGGVHASIILSESQASLETAADITRKHSNICLVAAPKAFWRISPLWVIHKDLKFTGSLLATPSQCADMLALIENNDIHIETKIYPFAQVNRMIMDAKAGKTDGRLVLTL